MSLRHIERASDSPYIESVIQGWSESEGSTIRPSESHWHMVFVRANGLFYPLVVGALTSSGVASWGAGGEILWIKFKLGTYMPRLPAKNLLNKETRLPDASSSRFWLDGSAWQAPSYENAETFVARLIRDDSLAFDPVVKAALHDEPPGQSVAPRTVRHRFLHTLGMTQTQVHQIQRAQRAAALLTQGYSILDTVDEAGYFDQPHLTRSLKRWVGYTPAQILKAG